MTVKISGIPEIQKKFESLTPKLQKKLLRSAMTKGARLIAREAKANVPVRTGALRASIRVAGLKGGKGAGLTARAGGKAAPVGKSVKAVQPYARIVEKRYKPFLATAKKDKEPEVRRLINEDVALQLRDMKQ